MEHHRGKHTSCVAPRRLGEPNLGYTDLPRDRYYNFYVPASRGMRRPGFMMEKPYRMKPGPKFAPPIPSGRLTAR